MRSSLNRSIFARSRVLLPFLLFLAACGSGEEDSPAEAPSQGGTGGQQQGGTSSGGTSSGISGASGKGGSPSSGGSGGTSSSQGGVGASAGSTGEAGKAGGAGAPGCSQDDQCAPLLPSTMNPKDCAEAVCLSGACVIRAKDKDGDGKASKFCKDTAGEVEIVVGNDCDDNDATRFPGAWDGPEGEGNPASCDGVDNDCSGTPDDNSLADGTSCACKPGAVAQCSEDSGGKTIAWPTGEPSGQCKYGSKTCAVDVNTGLGKWGPCTDAVPPGSEICDGVDNDCDGLLDDQDPDTTRPEWTCDGDNDDEASPDAKLLSSCNPPPAEECPGPNPSWKIKPPKTDCDDTRSDINKKGFEVCDEGPDGLGNDENCDGQKNENCACKNGTTQPCFVDPNGNPIPNSNGEAIGACKAGTQTCSGGQWGSCIGGQGPIQEVCANLDTDNDCDGDATEADDQSTYFCDKDSDGFLSTDAAQILSITLCGGAPTAGSNGCSGTWRPQGTPATDCNDSRADVNKNASEICANDGADENCDGQINEGCGCSNGATQSCFTDPNGNSIPNSNGEAIGACKAGTQTCSGGQWGTCVGGQGIATELCSNVNVDNDCDGDAAEADDKSTYFCDKDSDGFLSTDAAQVLSITLCGGAPTAGSNGCAGTWRPQGTPATDCNDSRADVNKNASEICANDGADENCNGQVNEGCGCSNGATQSCFTDPNGNPIPNSGGKAIGACKAGTQTCSGGQWGSCVGGQGPTQELCSNINVDNDCDGDAAEASDKSTYSCDKDSDGFLSTDAAQILSVTLCGAAPAAGSNGCTGTWRPQGTPATDCNDSRADVNKNASELCANDGADENCNGQVNEGCGCSNGATQSCFTDPNGNPIPNSGGKAIGACKAGTQTCSGGQWGTCIGGQGPALELCINVGVDNDCDGDAAEADDKKGWWCDGDSDGFAALSASPTYACDAPASGCTGPNPSWKQNLSPSDCNDSRADVNKNAPEVCANDGADENCDGQVNEPTVCTCTNGTSRACWKTGSGQDIPHNGNLPIGACKAGTETCTGGQWSACLNGVGPSGEFCSNINVDNDCDGDAAEAGDKSTYYCDKDSDGFLSTDAAQVLSVTLCGSAPAAGSNGCSGTWRPTGTPFTDCMEGNASINPNGVELCDKDINGVSLDENCNGQINEGCACTNGTTQKCFGDDPENQIPNSNGQAIGACKAGTKTCNSGQWSACIGGVWPSTELCANLGVDNDCDGFTDDADDESTYYCDKDGDGHLSSAPTTTKACQSTPPANSTCGATGKWTLSATPKDDCNDSAATVYTGATEFCGDNLDSNCVNGDSDGYNVGAACNVSGIAVGACQNGGAIACQSAGSTQTVCNANHPNIGKSVYNTQKAPNGSWDWSCDGNILLSSSVPNTSCAPFSCFPCSTTVTNFTAPSLLASAKDGNNLVAGDIKVAPFLNRVCAPNFGSPDSICQAIGAANCGASTVVYVDECCGFCGGMEASCGENITAIRCSNSSGSCKAIPYRSSAGCNLDQANFTVGCH